MVGRKTYDRVHSRRTELNCGARTAALQPISFVTLTRVTNSASRNWVNLIEVGSVQFSSSAANTAADCVVRCRLIRERWWVVERRQDCAASARLCPDHWTSMSSARWSRSQTSSPPSDVRDHPSTSLTRPFTGARPTATVTAGYI